MQRVVYAVCRYVYHDLQGMLLILHVWDVSNAVYISFNTSEFYCISFYTSVFHYISINTSVFHCISFNTYIVFHELSVLWFTLRAIFGGLVIDTVHCPYHGAPYEPYLVN